MAELFEKLKYAEMILRESGITEPRREASSLIAAALRRDKTFLIAHPEHELDPTDEQRVDEFIARRALHEPLQYISGTQEFYRLDFEVTPDVLIPRPETEMIVEHAIQVLGSSAGGFLCDVGTGSGCIPVSILHELPSTRAIGLDISKDALKVARRNAKRHHVNARLELRESDIFEALVGERFDLIVSNPPYVPVEDIAGLQAEVRDFEPHLALTDRSDGLSIIRRIVKGSPKFLRSRGHLFLEIGFNQSEKVARMFDLNEWTTVELYADLQGIPRLVSARLI